MSITDFIIVGILILLCVVFLFFIIAEIMRDSNKTTKQWKELDKEEEDEKWG